MSEKDLFELVLWMQNNIELEREREKRSFYEEVRERRRMCVGLCSFYVCCFFPLHEWNLKFISDMEYKG